MEAEIKDFIGVYKNAYSKEYCESLIKYFEGMSAAGLTETRQQGTPDMAKRLIDDEQVFAHETGKINGCMASIKQFNEAFWGQIYPHYSSAFDVLKDFDKHNNYSFKLQKTNIGGGYHHWHAESSSKQTAIRVLPWILYLNDVEEGGETEFLYYPRRVKPEAGTLVIWPAAFTHTHRGNPPISNTKYIVTGWIEF
jgi:hypothetical protein